MGEASQSKRRQGSGGILVKAGAPRAHPGCNCGCRAAPGRRAGPAPPRAHAPLGQQRGRGALVAAQRVLQPRQRARRAVQLAQLRQRDALRLELAREALDVGHAWGQRRFRGGFDILDKTKTKRCRRSTYLDYQLTDSSMHGSCTSDRCKLPARSPRSASRTLSRSAASLASASTTSRRAVMSDAVTSGCLSHTCGEARRPGYVCHVSALPVPWVACVMIP